MKTQKNIFCATLVILFVIGSSACAYYNVIDLGTLQGGDSCAVSINDNNQIVGGAGEQRACLFDPTGGGVNKDLKTLGGPGSAAFSINNSGQIVGWAHIGYGQGRACLFDPTGGGANINLGSDESCAYSINNSGQIVGEAHGIPFLGGYYRACLFDPTGGGANIDLGALSGYSYSGARGNNDHGQIVGWAGNGPASPYRACLFDPTGGGANIDLGPGSAYSINNSGQIVGGTDDSSGHSHPCLFDSTGGGANIVLGTVVGFDSAYALSINDHAQIVGLARNIANPGNPHAWFFDPTTGDITDLNSLINPTCGWTLWQANSINNNGWIVGYGSQYGQTRAFLLTPEPATLLLLGLGGLVLRKKSKVKN